jgi:signal transduction histidine kinase
MSRKAKHVSLPPHPGAMIEALRDIGYSLEAAIADLVDNSLTASAKHIDLRFGWDASAPWFAVIDDGAGLSSDELVEAMRPGSRDPREERSPDDLGRFGDSP